MFATARVKIKLWLRRHSRAQDLPSSSPQPSLGELANRAKEEWHLARAYFEQVKDSDLIDYAINNLEAAEKRYSYYIKQLRQN